MNTLIITLTDNAHEYIRASQLMDPDLSLSLNTVTSEFCRFNKTLTADGELIDISYVLRVDTEMFEWQMQSEVRHAISLLNSGVDAETLKAYQDDAIEVVRMMRRCLNAQYAEVVTVRITSEGQRVKSVQELEMLAVNDDLVENYGWERIRVTAEEAGVLVTKLEQEIDDSINEIQNSQMWHGVEVLDPPIIAVTNQAYNALAYGARNCHFDIEDYDYTFTMNGWETLTIYITNRNAWWNKGETETCEELFEELRRDHDEFMVLDDESERIPVFLPGEQWKVIEITDWVHIPPAYTIRVTNFENLEAAPF